MPCALSGSSPHARGTDGLGASLAHEARFIPARAGNSKLKHGAPGFRPVHPRTRGEQKFGVLDCGGLFGSSPHARGTVGQRCVRHCHHRFIPARAGNRPASTRAWPSGSVHPRTRGEQLCARLRRLPDGGSSPHARGTGSLIALQLQQLRFIPARAGNSRSAWGSSRRPTVHPRTRGEQAGKVTMEPSHSGSSPHARGTALEQLGIDGVDRFIPARAGNSLNLTR